MSAGRGDDKNLAAGGPARHIPVLRAAALAALELVPGHLYVDGTFGAGGYTSEMLKAGARVIAFDRDPTAIAAGAPLMQASGGQLRLVEARFGEMVAQLAALDLGPGSLDGVVLDIGVSSMQIDQAERGFSFRQEGPLDMRMSASGRSAFDIVQEASVEELADIFFYYGEERASRRIARAIVHDRETQPFTTTRQLAEMIARVCPGKPHEIHPATRVFQALRIAVNDELGELVSALEGAELLLKPGGRLAVVTFHSLEDRIVKMFFAARSGRGEAVSRLLPGEPARAQNTFVVPSRQPVLPTQVEMLENPRARSAKLRFGIRNEAPARPTDPKLTALGRLPAAAVPTRAKGR